jgi:hypothetical protein
MLICVSAFPLTSFAQASAPAPTPAGTKTCYGPPSPEGDVIEVPCSPDSDTVVTSNGNGTSNQTTTAHPTLGHPNGTPVATTNIIPTPKATTCGPFNLGECALGFMGTIMYYLMAAAGYLLGLVGVLFNWIIVITVFQYGAYFGNSAGMLIAWGILRDIGNIVLLFGFILISVMVILDVHGFDAKRALPRFIIFAVLLNFSLFASEAVVDLANGLSATLYKQAGQSALSDKNSALCGSSGADSSKGGVACPSGQSSLSDTQVGIAGVIVHDTYLGSAFSWTKPPTEGQNGEQLFAYIGTTMLILTVMVLLLAASVMFFTRAVMLTILLVLSPLGFAAMAIPQFAGRAKEWLNKLIANAFFAPVFLLLIFVGLKVMEGARTAIGGDGAKTLADMMTSPGSNIGGVFIVYGLTIGFMVAALMFAKSSGAAGASFATGFAEKAVRGVAMAPVRVAAGVGGAGYRVSVGKVSSVASKKYDVMMGKLRSGGVVGKGISGTMRVLGADDALHGGLQGLQKVKPFGTRSFEEDEKHREERTKHLEHAKHTAEFSADIKAGTAEGGDRELAERALNRMPEADLVKTLEKMGDAQIKVASGLLSLDRFKKLMDNKDVDDHLKDKLLARYEELQKAGDMASGTPAEIAAQHAALKKAAEDLGLVSKDYEILGTRASKLLDTMINSVDDPSVVDGTGRSVISAKILAGIKDGESYTKAQRATAKSKTVYGQLNSAVASGTATSLTKQNLARSAGEDIAEASATTLLDPDVIDTFDRKAMSKIMAKDKFTRAQRDVVLAQMKRRAAADPAYRTKMAAFLKQGTTAGDWWGVL